METLVKTRKPRTRKEVNPQISALKKSVSAALKAAWMVESVRTRQEKAVRRSRVTLEKKVEEQRDALKAIKAAVDAFLSVLDSMPAITPSQADPLKDHPELPMGRTLVETFAGQDSEAITPEVEPVLEDPSAVVLDPSAAA